MADVFLCFSQVMGASAFLKCHGADLCYGTATSFPLNCLKNALLFNVCSEIWSDFLSCYCKLIILSHVYQNVDFIDSRV
jgi:hypothetical protein